MSKKQLEVEQFADALRDMADEYDDEAEVSGDWSLHQRAHWLRVVARRLMARVL